MSHVRRMFFPLRSNSRWFQRSALQDELERRLKTYAIIYDELIFENGRLIDAVWDTGYKQLYMSPAAINEDRTKIREYEPGAPLTFSIKAKEEDTWHPLLQGPTTHLSETDFLPILTRTGLLACDFVRPQQWTLSDERTKTVAALAKKDISENDLLSLLPGSRFEIEALVKSIHLDSDVAYAHSAAFTGHINVAGYVSAKGRQLASRLWRPDPAWDVLLSATEVLFPDFSELPWDEVLAARESAAGRDLRRVIARLGDEIIRNAQELTDPRDRKELMRSLFIRELLADMGSYVPTVDKVTVSFISNLLPVAGVATSAAEAMELLQYRQSWLSLVRTQHSPTDR